MGVTRQPFMATPAAATAASTLRSPSNAAASSSSRSRNDCGIGAPVPVMPMRASSAPTAASFGCGALNWSAKAR